MLGVRWGEKLCTYLSSSCDYWGFVKMYRINLYDVDCSKSFKSLTIVRTIFKITNEGIFSYLNSASSFWVVHYIFVFRMGRDDWVNIPRVHSPGISAAIVNKPDASKGQLLSVN